MKLRESLHVPGIYAVLGAQHVPSYLSGSGLEHTTTFWYLDTCFPQVLCLVKALSLLNAPCYQTFRTTQCIVVPVWWDYIIIMCGSLQDGQEGNSPPYLSV